MIELYSDISLRNAVTDDTLLENITYYARLKYHDPSIIEKEISSGQCAPFIDWIPSNQVGQIAFRDIAGFVNLFGATYNVKSTKLLSDLSGTNQIEYLLKEISEYSSTLVFSPAAPATFQYEIDQKKLTGNIFYIYQYLSNNLFHDRQDSLHSLFQFILDSPHFNQRSTKAYTPTFSTKKFSYATFQRIAIGISDSTLLSKDHEFCKNSFVEKMPEANHGEKLLPKKLYSITNTTSYDTPENRFLKYFLMWCQEIFLTIQNRYPQYSIVEDCDKSLKTIRKYLFHPFFNDIGAFSFLPTNSSVLANRVGYREIFLHYLKSRNQPKIFEGYLSDLFYTTGIKNISTLYEYWVFFRIAKELFGTDATLSILGLQRESSGLKYGLKVSNKNLSLFYNKTYKHSPFDSYNFSLRPDISLEVNDGDKVKRYFFDAKYSSTSIPNKDDEIIAVYKNPNVVKMLSYLDAIYDSEFAVIVYPGTEFAFYSKRFKDNNNFSNKPEFINDFKGVGALPLSPNHKHSNQIFSAFMSRFKMEIFH